MVPRDWQEKKGILPHHFPPFLISHHSLCLLYLGEHLRICPQEYTCCSSEIEERLTWDTEATFRSLVEENGSFLVHTLASRHRAFDGEDLGVPKPGHTPPRCAHDPSKYILSSLPTLSLRHPCPVLAPPSPPQALSRVLPHPILNLPKSESCSVSNSLVFFSPHFFLAFALSLVHPSLVSSRLTPFSLHLPQRFFGRCSPQPSTPWPCSSPAPMVASIPSIPPYSAACSRGCGTTMRSLVRG